MSVSGVKSRASSACAAATEASFQAGRAAPLGMGRALDDAGHATEGQPHLAHFSPSSSIAKPAQTAEMSQSKRLLIL